VLPACSSAGHEVHPSGLTLQMLVVGLVLEQAVSHAGDWVLGGTLATLTTEARRRTPCLLEGNTYCLGSYHESNNIWCT
jgi:hypothetical protein